MSTAETTDEKPSPGAMLRAARERQGLHIAALAAAIKIPPRKLEALEEDRWDELPGTTFTRALAQTVCRTLKTDPRPVLEHLPPTDHMPLDPLASDLNMPFGRAGRGSRAGQALGGVRPVWVGAALLALAALVLFFLPESLWNGKPVADAPRPAPAPASAAPAAAVPTGTTGATAGTTPAPGTAAPVLAVAPAVAPASAAIVPPATAVPLRGVLRVEASEKTWIEVRDRRGQVLVSRELAAGEAYGVDGSPPLQLVVGNAAAAKVTMRGQAVDLAAHARANVARVDLP